MKIRKILICGILVTGLVACGDQSSDQPDAPSSSESASAANMLERVPADTPYLFVNTQGMSDELYDHYMQQYAGTFDMMSNLLDDVELEEDGDDSEEALAFMSKFYTLLSDIDSSDSLRNKIGISPNGLSTFYGAGIFPVMSIQVVDANKVSDTINNLISDDSGNNSSQNMDVDGISVNKLVFAEDHLAFYWSVGSQAATFSVLPIQLESSYLNQIFGDARPDNAYNMSQITDMNGEYGFSNYGSGFVDFTRIFDQLTSADTPEGASFAAMLQEEGNNFLDDPVCVSETRSLLDNAPRMYFGITEMSTTEMGMRSILNLASDLRSGLAGVVGNAPIGNDPGTPMNFGVNLNLAGLRDFIANESNSVLESPFSCSHLDGLNEAAQQMNAGVNQPMLPMIGNINGFRLSLANLDLDNMDPTAPEQIAQSLSGHMVLYTAQPNMLIGLGQMTLPFLAGMDLEPGGDPQLLDTTFIPGDIGPAYLAVSDAAIGLSVGDQQEAGLTSLLSAASDSEPVLFNFGMDYKLYSQFLNMLEGVADSTDEVSENDEQFREMMQQLSATYENLGYTFTKVLVNDQGVVMDQSMYMDN